jgi:Cu(I)/Ag(I) efflux system membrane fusion protein
MMNRARAASTTTTTPTEAPIPTFSAPQEFSRRLDGLVSTYLALKDALVAADKATARSAAAKLNRQLAMVTNPDLSSEAQQFLRSQAEPLKRNTAELAQAASVDEQRRYFISLSNQMLAIMQAFPSDERTLYHQYCPMADSDSGANWLSAEPEIRNPYYGSLMLNCGETVKEF